MGLWGVAKPVMHTDLMADWLATAAGVRLAPRGLQSDRRH